jgi:hypothetical protein
MSLSLIVACHHTRHEIFGQSRGVSPGENPQRISEPPGCATMQSGERLFVRLFGAPFGSIPPAAQRFPANMGGEEPPQVRGGWCFRRTPKATNRSTPLGRRRTGWPIEHPCRGRGYRSSGGISDCGQPKDDIEKSNELLGLSRTKARSYWCAKVLYWSVVGSPAHGR